MARAATGFGSQNRGLPFDTVDVSPLGVAKARKHAEASGVSTNVELADLLTWTWPKAQYDIVAAIFVHFFDEDRARMHRAMIGALKPGGLLILEAYRPEQIELQKIHHSGGPRSPDMLFFRKPSCGAISKGLPS